VEVEAEAGNHGAVVEGKFCWRPVDGDGQCLFFEKLFDILVIRDAAP